MLVKIVLYAAALAMVISCAPTIVLAQTSGPTEAGAAAAEQGLAKAWESNDAQALGAYLAPDWLVVSTHGGTDGREDVLQGIQQGSGRIKPTLRPIRA